jgi:hypothetical protein
MNDESFRAAVSRAHGPRGPERLASSMDAELLGSIARDLDRKGGAQMTPA